ncbi:hypothetical protein MYP_2847 [Sporocytophaga myxococcoides]|uniref:Uncharacterized protein n=1 Tax=Sporocytophaga myxococcoides TaxID=153721 RepID=A0A098LHJ3_9BACT|nr:hypothetical protein [Sporocytophaga myxococcoides]GAL85618.1 hypothetical protein MYP_2847 [Sporocytophaga myxococcoides]
MKRVGSIFLSKVEIFDEKDKLIGKLKKSFFYRSEIDAEVAKKKSGSSKELFLKAEDEK